MFKSFDNLKKFEKSVNNMLDDKFSEAMVRQMVISAGELADSKTVQELGRAIVSVRRNELSAQLETN